MYVHVKGDLTHSLRSVSSRNQPCQTATTDSPVEHSPIMAIVATKQRRFADTMSRDSNNYVIGTSETDSKTGLIEWCSCSGKGWKRLVDKEKWSGCSHGALPLTL